MLHSWRPNLAGRPPRLKDYLDGVAATPPLRATPALFVAVGLAISDNDTRTLGANRTAWGAELLRSTAGKAWHRGGGTASEPSYIDAAIVDFAVCRAAAWLVGWTGSTFLRALAELRAIDYRDAPRRHRAGWYAVCPRGRHNVADDGGLQYFMGGHATGHAACLHRSPEVFRSGRHELPTSS